MDLIARDIMTHPVVTTREDMTVRELMEILHKNGISGVPVINAESELVGVVSITDLISEGIEDRVEIGEADFHTSPAMDDLSDAYELLEPEAKVLNLPVSRIMSRNVITAENDASIGKLADLMVTNRIHRVIIVQNDKISGIVSVMDILNSLRDQAST